MEKNKTEKVWLSLGSNLFQPIKQINNAIQSISKIPKIKIVGLSSYYYSLPMGPKDQPNYINIVLQIDCSLDPENLLNYTQSIELSQGRKRNGNKWGPRSIDIDILLFGNLLIHSSRLTIPHYDMKNREFILFPMKEIEDNFHFPDGKALSDVLKDVKNRNIIKRL